MSRLNSQPGERIDRTRKVSFTFDGKRVEAYEGDTIGSALYAAGQRTFSRSFKYHRRRGLMCCAGQCPNCIVRRRTAAPGARACTEPVREGITVEPRQRGPVARVRRRCARGRPLRRSVHPARILLQDVHPAPASCGRCTRRCCAMQQASASCATSSPSANGGPSTAAATPTCSSSAAAHRRACTPRPPPRALGADVVLADEGAEPGGQQLVEGERSRRCCAGASARASRGRDHRPRLRARLLRRHGRGLAGRHPAPGPRRPARVRDRHDSAAARVRRQRPARRDARRGRPPAGGPLRGQPRSARGDRHHRRTAVCTPRQALQPPSASRSWPSPTCAARGRQAGRRELRGDGIPVFTGHTVIEAKGLKAGHRGRDRAGRRRLEHRCVCDLVVVSGGAIPASSLLLQAGARTRYAYEALGHFALADVPDGVGTPKPARSTRQTT